MKIYFKTLVVCIIIFMISVAGCETGDDGEAELILDGDLLETYSSDGFPQFEGYVKNVGDKAAYEVEVEITCYSDADKTNVIDTAKGYPANSGNIEPGQRVFFDAVCFNLQSHDQIRTYKYEITYRW